MSALLDIHQLAKLENKDISKPYRAYYYDSVTLDRQLNSTYRCLFASPRELLSLFSLTSVTSVNMHLTLCPTYWLDHRRPLYLQILKSDYSDFKKLAHGKYELSTLWLKQTNLQEREAVLAYAAALDRADKEVLDDVYQCAEDEIYGIAKLFQQRYGLYDPALKDFLLAYNLEIKPIVRKLGEHISRAKAHRSHKYSAKAFDTSVVYAYKPIIGTLDQLSANYKELLLYIRNQYTKDNIDLEDAKSVDTGGVRAAIDQEIQSLVRQLIALPGMLEDLLVGFKVGGVVSLGVTNSTAEELMDDFLSRHKPPRWVVN